MESFATPYPIYFQDDDGEPKALGHIGVHSVLTFKRFQALMSQKTNLPANQLSAVFVCRRMVGDVDKRQKLPVNENTNFNIILNQHNPTRERDAHFLISIKKSKKDRKGGVGGKKKNDADEEDDDSVEADLAQSPPDKGRLALAMGAPPAAPPALTAAQAREAAQRERERLNLALGRVASGGVADVKPGAAVASKPVVVAPAAVARPAAAPVPQPPPLAGTAAAALRGAGAAVPAPLASAVTQMPRTLSQQPGGVGGGAPPGAAVAAKQTGAPVPVAGPPRPNSGVAPGQSQPGGAALARLGPPALSGIAGGARPGSDEGAAADAVALPKGPAACKFCIFCRDRGHEPPFHWCSDDRAVMPPLRGPSPYGAVRQAISV